MGREGLTSTVHALLPPGAFAPGGFLYTAFVALNDIIGAASGTPFQKKVWRALCGIKKGEVITYKELARRVGKPQAVRAVANAVGKNPFAPEVPCHRVVRTDGALGGYSGKGGVKTKLALLRKEGIVSSFAR